jgi:hypothetical protein
MAPTDGSSRGTACKEAPICNQSQTHSSKPNAKDDQSHNARLPNGAAALGPVQPRHYASQLDGLDQPIERDPYVHRSVQT